MFGIASCIACVRVDKAFQVLLERESIFCKQEATADENGLGSTNIMYSRKESTQGRQVGDELFRARSDLMPDWV